MQNVGRWIKDTIERRLNELAEQEEVWRHDWVTEWVTQEFSEAIDGTKGDAAEVQRYCAHATVRGLVAAAIRKRTDPTLAGSAQLVFEGFPRVQAYYAVTRDSEAVAVPVLRMTIPERRAKVAELRTAGNALLEHADQLELFFESRSGGIGA